jgi:cysteine desulfurase
MKELFLDSNAHFKLNNKALITYQNFHNSKASYGHVSALSEPGRLSAAILEESRNKIAQLIGAKSANQIIFTNSCTQACEWGLDILRKIKVNTNDCTYYSSAIEHSAVRDKVEKENYNFLLNDENGYVDWKKHGLDKYCLVLEDMIVNRKVSCIHSQNEIGTIQDFSNIGRHRVNYLFSDMSQSLGKTPINVTDLNVDIAAFGCHKFGGFGNLGFVYLKESSNWIPFGTGSRYFMDRAGTLDVGSIVASAVALEDSLNTLDYRIDNCLEFKLVLEKGLEERGFKIIAKNANRLPNTTYVRVPNSDSLTILMNLDKNNIHVGLGSACGSIATSISKTMKALGEDGTMNDFLRISQEGYYNGKDAKYFLDILDSCG